MMPAWYQRMNPRERVLSWIVAGTVAVLLNLWILSSLWGAVASADVRALQAPFRSGIAIEDYQLDPVVRAISNSSAASLRHVPRELDQSVTMALRGASCVRLNLSGLTVDVGRARGRLPDGNQ